MVIAACGAAWALSPKAPAPPDAPAGDFSAQRALERLDRIVGEPRNPGSPAHLQAREDLLAELSALGWETEVHQAVGLFVPEPRGTVTAGAVSNVVATWPGTDPTGTVILAAHYDTVPGSPGGADDGIGIATVLETARALTAEGEPPRNDLLVLLTDAEEPGLLGAEAFSRERADELGTAVVLNHEARGAGGLPVAARATSPNSVLAGLLARAPGAVYESATEAVFELLPNDTDFTRFSSAGLHGTDTAISGGGAIYHAPIDDVAHLSGASLQRMGDVALAVARDAAGADLTEIAAGDERIATTLPWGLLTYPAALEVPLAIGALVLAAGAVMIRRGRGAVSVPRVAAASAAALAATAVSGAAAVLLWQVALLVDPAQSSVFVGEPYLPWPYQVGVVLLAASTTLGLRLLRRWLPGEHPALGALLLVALLGTLAAFALPGVSGLLVQPALPAALAAVVAALVPEGRRRARAAVVGVGLLPAAVLLGPGVVGSFDVGMEQGAPLSAVLTTVLVLLALPLLAEPVTAGPRTDGRRDRREADAARLWSGRSDRWSPSPVPVALLVLAVAATATGLVVNREGATEPRQELVAYSLDLDTGQGTWTSWRPARSAWTQSLLTSGPEPLPRLPWLSDGDLAHGPAPAVDLDGPRAAVVADVVAGGRRELTLDLSSRRGATAVGLWVADGTAVQAAWVEGREVPVRDAGPGWSFGLMYRGLAHDGAESVRVRLQLSAGEVEIRLADLSHDLTQAPTLDVPEDRLLVTPEVFVARTVRL